MRATRTILCVALTTVAALDGCATPAGRAASARPAQPAVVAENQSAETIDVYLIHELREWHLGRLAPGAAASLPLPAWFTPGTASAARLAVVAGAPRTLRPSGVPGAVATMQQPLGALLGQRWTFAQGQLVGRPPRPR